MSLSLKEIEENHNRICSKYDHCTGCLLEFCCEISDIVEAEKIISEWVKDNPDEAYHDDDFPDDNDPKTYERGLKDAWELAGELCRGDFTDRDLKVIFDYELPENILTYLTAEDAIQRVNKYKEKFVKYGDVIIATSIGNERLIVVGVSDGYIRCISGNFNDYTLSTKTDNFEKTGLNVSDELDELLEVGGWDAEEYDHE